MTGGESAKRAGFDKTRAGQKNAVEGFAKAGRFRWRTSVKANAGGSFARVAIDGIKLVNDFAFFIFSMFQ